MGKSIADLTHDIANSVHVCTIEFKGMPSSKPLDVYGDSKTGVGVVCSAQGKPVSWDEIQGLDPKALAAKVSGFKHPGTITWHNGFGPQA